MRIKYLLAAMTACAVCWTPLHAQEEMETRHEISLSYGTVPNSAWMDVMSEMFSGMFGERSENNKYYGPIGLEYYYHTSKLMAVGAIATFATNTEDRYMEKDLISKVRRSYFSVMPSLKLNWLNKKHWGLYSKVAAGVTYGYCRDKDYEKGISTGKIDTYKDLFFNFQATAIGIESGGNNVRGFLELGVGEQGVALAGVRYKF